MFTSSNTSTTEMYREELSFKLGKVSFYGKLRYWCHIISSKVIEVDKAKVDLISNLPPPKIIREARFFLGHASFYRRFIKDFSKISRPFCNLLAKDTPFIFDDSCFIIYIITGQLPGHWTK